jgi:hypothetical protein
MAKHNQFCAAFSAARSFSVIPALALITGCASINDSGVALLRKPDLGQVTPGTPVNQVASLQKPAKKRPVNEADAKGPEIWLYEWDLPGDEVNNKMFTSVVVKDGIILGYAEETPDKWMKNPQLHKLAKLDSAFEDMTSLNARVANHQLPPMPSNAGMTAAPDSWGLLRERSRFITQEGAEARAAASGVQSWDAPPYGRQVGPVEALLAQQNPCAAAVVSDLSSAPSADSSASLSPEIAVPPPPAPEVPGAPSVQPAATVAANDSATSPVATKKTLRELEAEELRIRKDSSLTKTERMQKLREIWKLQLEVSGKKAV